MATVPASSIGGVLPPEDSRTTPLTPQVSAAVRVLNESEYLGEGRQVVYTVDPSSRKPVVRVVDMSTNEVITQWPEPYVLELAAQAKAQAEAETTNDEAVGD